MTAVDVRSEECLLAGKLAAMERECPEPHEGHEGYLDRSCNGQPCHLCHGTGRVSLFEGVRDYCDSQTIQDGNGRMRHFHTGFGWADDCPGHTVTLDLQRWLVAVQKALGYVNVEMWVDHGHVTASAGVGNTNYGGIGHAALPITALLRAVEKAVQT